MYRKGMHGDRRGVAGAVATMFVLLVVLAFINIYITGFVPAAMRTQEYNHMQQLTGEFSVFQQQNYNLESGGWPYPVTSTMVLGSSGDAPFASPTNGVMSFSTSSFSMSLSYALGLPLSLPSCNHDFYQNNTGTSTSPIGIHASFYTDSNNSFYTSSSGPAPGPGPGGNTNPVFYAAQGSTVCYVINSSYVAKDDYDVFLGGNGGPTISNLTLVVYVYGSHNIIDFTGTGNNLTIWYISYGSDNQVFDNNNKCGFSFNGQNDKGYIQDYGTGDTSPFGWPQFRTIMQYSSLSGSLSASVGNQFYVPQTIVYQGGAVIVSQNGASVMQSGPEFRAVNGSSSGASVSLNLISLLGQSFSEAGTGAVALTTSYFSSNSISVGQYNGLNRINALNLTIHSAYASAWAKYFAFSLSNLQNVTSNPSVAYVGNGCTDLSTAPVTWGAYSLTVTGDTLQLSIYNIASLALETGAVQASAS